MSDDDDGDEVTAERERVAMAEYEAYREEAATRWPGVTSPPWGELPEVTRDTWVSVINQGLGDTW